MADDDDLQERIEQLTTEEKVKRAVVALIAVATLVIAVVFVLVLL